MRKEISNIIDILNQDLENNFNAFMFKMGIVQSMLKSLNLKICEDKEIEALINTENKEYKEKHIFAITMINDNYKQAKDIEKLTEYITNLIKKITRIEQKYQSLQQIKKQKGEQKRNEKD